MVEVIAKVVLGGSLIGMGTILARKIPLLSEIPEEEIEKFDWRIYLLNLLNRFKKVKTFSFGVFSKQILPRVKVLKSAAEEEIDVKVKKLKEETKEKGGGDADNYWEELKKVKNQKDKDLPA